MISSDALSQATAIARSAALEEIDWTGEPLSERERAGASGRLKQRMRIWRPLCDTCAES